MSKNVPTFEEYMQYKELSKTKAKELRQLSAKKERDKKGLFLIEGDKSVKDSLNDFELEYLICTSNWIESNKGIAEKFKEHILCAEKSNIEIISSFNSVPEIIAVFHKKPVVQLIPDLKEGTFYVLLDEIQDPGNLGTIIRTCDWFGVYDIFASKDTADVYGPKVVQSAMGSLSRVNVNYLDLESLILKNKNIRVIGTLLDGKSIFRSDLPKGGMLLMGNEGRGISHELKKFITDPVSIPPVNKSAHPDSLNVAIATAICLSHLIS